MEAVNGEVTAYAETLKEARAKVTEMAKKAEDAMEELAAAKKQLEAKEAEKSELEITLANVQETKEAQNSSFEALK